MGGLIELAGMLTILAFSGRTMLKLTGRFPSAPPALPPAERITPAGGRH